MRNLSVVEMPIALLFLELDADAAVPNLRVDEAALIGIALLLDDDALAELFEAGRFLDDLTIVDGAIVKNYKALVFVAGTLGGAACGFRGQQQLWGKT